MEEGSDYGLLTRGGDGKARTWKGGSAGRSVGSRTHGSIVGDIGWRESLWMWMDGWMDGCTCICNARWMYVRMDVCTTYLTYV
jgi:hypothetical protein